MFTSEIRLKLQNFFFALHIYESIHTCTSITLRDKPKRHLMLYESYSLPLAISASMLGPALNRQPGFRRGTRRAKQRREEQPCRVAGWLPSCLIG